MHRFIFFLIVPVFIIGCENNLFFEQKHEIPNQEWTYADTLVFNFTVQDSTQVFNIWLDVEHTPDYAYQNLYLQIFTQLPNKVRQKDLLSLELADKAGVWQGECDEVLCQTAILIQEKVFFEQLGDYEIVLKQFMRVNPLEAVKNFGLRLEKVSLE